MKSTKTLALVAIAATLLLSCKNDSKQTSTTPENTLLTPSPSPKPEIYLYAVSVDKLNLRLAPSKDGELMDQFAEGEIVEGTGEVSSNKEEVTLRGIPYNEPYFKIKSTKPEHQYGWAYSAALVPVYAGSRTTNPDLDKLAKLTAYLKTLDPKKLESGKKAWEYVSTNLGNAQGTLADATFILLQRFLFRIEIEGDLYLLAEKIKWTDADYTAIDEEKFDVNKYPLTKQFPENGFRLEVGEGMVFPVVDWSKLGALFAAKVTPPMKNYIEQSIVEQKEKMWSDGGIIIPLEEVADRAVWWERFNQQNPYFVLSEETQNSEKGLVFMLICGADNTPVFDYENQSVTEDYKKAWKYVQEKHSGTGLAKAVKEFSDLISSEGGKKTKKVEVLTEKYMRE